MKKTASFILSLMYALTLATPTISSAAEFTESGGDLLMKAYAASVEISEIDEDEVKQQTENNLIYSEITEAYNDEDETISFDYAGGYVNENGELVICASGEESSNIEIQNELSDICSIDTSDIIVKKVKYSYEELEKARADFENDIENYKAQTKGDNNSDIYDLLSSITSNSIDDEFNKLIIYVPNLDDNKLVLLNELFNYGDIIAFENDEDFDIELRATLRPGQGIIGWSEDDYCYFGSIGYRAYYKCGLNTYYGFCTAAHVTESFPSCNGVKNVYRADDGGKIGPVMAELRLPDFGVDAAFVCVDTTFNTFSNDYLCDFLFYPLEFCSNKWFTYLPKNTTVYKVGSTTGFSEGVVKSSSYSVYISYQYHKDVVKTSLKSEGGDSGGLVFAYDNGDGNGGYIPAGIIIGGNAFSTFYSKCTNIIDVLNIYPY